MIIAISNQKGGVAKTTTCLSLGGCLAARGYKVLAVDCDAQANLTAGLGVEPEMTEMTHAQVYLQPDCNVDNLLYSTDVNGLDVLPAEMDLAVVEKQLHNEPDFERRLAPRLHALHQRYDFILCDCPPSLGVLTLNALSAADLVIIPTACEYYAVSGLSQILAVVDMVRKRTNPRLSYRILVTMLDRRVRMCKLVLQQLRRNFQGALLTTVIGVDCKLKESQAEGMPVNVYAPRTRASIQYSEMADEVMALAHRRPANPAVSILA